MQRVARQCPSFAVEGGSGTQVPDVSIKVDDVDDAYNRAIRTGFEIPYGIATEPWGVRRFFVCFGKIVNVLSHSTVQETGSG